MKKGILYIIIFVAGLVLGAIIGIYIFNLDSSTADKYSVAISSSHGTAAFVTRINNLTGEVDVALIRSEYEKSKEWFRVGEK